MPEYLDDPSVLTKDKLKSELLAHNVELPSGNPTKDVYIRLYLKNLTAKNRKHATAITLDGFSSDDELPLPVVSRSRSSGRKATRKTDKVQPDELDVTVLTDQGIKDNLLKQGEDTGPIVVPTQKLYKKRLLEDGPAQQPRPELLSTEIQDNCNGNSESNLYSDKEEEVEAEPVAEPEPVPVVEERPLKFQGKITITPHTSSNQHHLVEKIAASDQTLKMEESDVLKELFTSGINSPTGITVTCRRPIKGAANCTAKSGDLWNHDNFLFSPKTKTTSSFSSYTDSRSVNRMTSFPSSTSLNSSTPISSYSAGLTCRQRPGPGPGISLWIKLFLLATLAGFLFLVYQAMETNSINPFAGL